MLKVLFCQSDHEANRGRWFHSDWIKDTKHWNWLKLLDPIQLPETFRLLCFDLIFYGVFVGVKRSTRKKPSRYHLRCWPLDQHSLISEDEKPERLRCRDEEQGKLMEERYGNGRGAFRNEDMRNHANTSSYNDYYCCCHYYFTIINHVREKPMLFRNRSGVGWGVLK